MIFVREPARAKAKTKAKPKAKPKARARARPAFYQISGWRVYSPRTEVPRRHPRVHAPSDIIQYSSLRSSAAAASGGRNEHVLEEAC